MVYHIAINIDDKYIEHASAMLVSLFYHNRELHFAVHVITSQLTTSTIESLKLLVSGQYHHELFIHQLDTRQTDRFPEYHNSHISMAANYRLFLADILPSDIHRVLYLDCDLIVKGSIKPLVESPLSDNAVAAVEDMWSGKEDCYQRLGYSRHDGYFNSGVMVISLDYWRHHQLSKQFIAYLESHPHLVFVDQDILNGVLHDKWMHLPLCWNLQDGFLRRKRKIRKELLGKVDDACKNPKIIHFTGSRKPWDEDCMNPYKEEYFKYLDMTTFHGKRPQISAHWRRKALLSKLLIALHLKSRRYRKDFGGEF